MRMREDINSGLTIVPMMKPFERTRVRYSRLMIAINLSILLSPMYGKLAVCLDYSTQSFGKTRLTASLPYPRATIFILLFALRQLFQKPSCEFRRFTVLSQLAFQPFKIFRRVHVVPFGQQYQVQLGLSRSIHRRFHYAPRPPRNVLEDSPVKFAHPDQV